MWALDVSVRVAVAVAVSVFGPVAVAVCCFLLLCRCWMSGFWTSQVREENNWTNGQVGINS